MRNLCERVCPRKRTGPDVCGSRVWDETWNPAGRQPETPVEWGRSWIPRRSGDGRVAATSSSPGHVARTRGASRLPRTHGATPSLVSDAIWGDHLFCSTSESPAPPARGAMNGRSIRASTTACSSRPAA